MKKQTIYGMLAAVMLVVLVSVGLVSGGANAQGDPTPSPELEEALERAANFSGGNADWTPVIQDFDGVEMVLVPAGCFEMGSTDEQIEAAFQLCEREYGTGQCDRGWFELERPVHDVCFEEPFWIGRTEVTNAQYKACVDAGVCTLPDSTWHYSDPAHADHPMVDVDWFQADAYAAWVGGSLPTEAQWEYAARGPDGLAYPWGDAVDGTQINFCDINCPNDSFRNAAYDDGYESTAPVGSYPDGASWVGALDMSGNVWEWTSSIYADYPYDTADGREDAGATSERRGLRGGSWGHFQYAARVAFRYYYLDPSLRSFDFGFRVVRVFPIF